MTLLFAMLLLMQQPPPTIHRVAWLQGCWESSAKDQTIKDQTIEEQWMAPRAGTMMGMSRTVQGGKLETYELALIVEQGPVLAFKAHPSGQPPATFLSSVVEGTRVVFENPNHDFPQQIAYERRGDSLLAWIAGTQSGKSRRFDFSFTRVACGVK
jgi:Domain of unknown function (DUF6265)